jgi:hypothetical protein
LADTVFQVSPAVSSVATHLVVAQQATTAMAGAVITPAIKVAIETSSGAVVTTDTSNVTLTIASGPVGATVGGTVSLAAVKGIATFSNLKLNIAGIYTLKASDGALAVATSKTITVVAAAAAKLAIGEQPSTGTAGKALSRTLTVKVEDAFGNVVTTNTSTVTLAKASGPPTGTLAGTASVKVVRGIATFSNLILKIAGGYTLKATDGSLTAAASQSIMISPAAAAKLAITQQPSTGKTGVAFTPGFLVKVEDAFGNIVTSDASTIMLALDTFPSGAIASGTLSAKAVKGIATLSNVRVNRAGTYTFIARTTTKASGGAPLTAAVSKSLIVT